MPHACCLILQTIYEGIRAMFETYMSQQYLNHILVDRLFWETPTRLGFHASVVVAAVSAISPLSFILIVWLLSRAYAAEALICAHRHTSVILVRHQWNYSKPSKSCSSPSVMDPRQLIDAQFDRAVQIVQSLPKTGPIQTGYEEKLTMYRYAAIVRVIHHLSNPLFSLYKQGASLLWVIYVTNCFPDVLIFP